MSIEDSSGVSRRAEIPLQMTAVLQAEYGDTSVLRVGQSTVPSVGRDEVLLKVRAAGISRGVWHLMTGEPYLVRLASGFPRPRHSNPGMDVCGDIVAVGDQATNFELGQRVFGIAQESFAEYAVAKVSKVAVAPKEWSDLEASVVAESGLTALQALDAAGLAAPDGRRRRVLVIGASGGVGSFAVMLAASYGAEVSAVCSLNKADYVRSLGAARTFDYRREDPLAVHRAYDVILDIAGGATLHALRWALAPDGHLVFVGNESGEKWAGGYGRPFAYQARMAFGSQRFTNLLVRTTQQDLVRLADMAITYGLRPPLSAHYSMSDVGLAVDHLTSGDATGKIALSIDAKETRS